MLQNISKLIFLFCSVKHWLSKGCPKEKLIVGIPTYGRSWTLSSSSTSILSGASGAGNAGIYSGEAGLLMYSEICVNIANNGWTKVTDSTGFHGPYAYNGNQWVGYDDTAIAAVKAQYIVDNNLGGAMFWDLPSDDFKNLCGEGKYPIVSTVHNTVSRGTTCASGPSTSSSSSSSSVSTSTVSTTTTIQTTNAGGTVSCVDPNGFYPHPSDCQKYFQCGGGVAYEYTCPDGTLWNNELKFCDWEANVECNSGGSGSESSVTTVSETTIVLPEESCSGTICGSSSSEPITEEVKSQRESASCTLANDKVNSIEPLSSTNPQNVKNVEAIFPESMFNEFFSDRNSAYTYTNFLKAIGKYPAICSSADLCPKILANMFGHIQQETANLYYIEEINKSPYCEAGSQWVVEAYPCVTGQMYYGRGAKQLSWNYNYGAFSNAMFGDAMVLLSNPDLVATTWLNFAASMWFYVTPQPPKPSMLQVLDGTWIPNSHDLSSNLVPGFGVTTMIINGALECGGWNQQAQNRANYYTEYANKLNVNIDGEKLLCNDMQQFSMQGSAGGLALYWAPESSCSLVTWQTAFNALIEGDYSRCQGITPSCNNETEVTTATTESVTESTNSETTECTETKSMKVVCYYSNWPYYRNGKSMEVYNLKLIHLISISFQEMENFWWMTLIPTYAHILSTPL